jgi:hypothetical protein
MACVEWEWKMVKQRGKGPRRAIEEGTEGHRMIGESGEGQY